MTWIEALSRFRIVLKPEWLTALSTFEGWLRDLLSYGPESTRDLRAWANRFTLSRREFADLYSQTLQGLATPSQMSRALIFICDNCSQLEFQRFRIPIEGGQACSACRTSHFLHCDTCGLWQKHTRNDGTSAFVAIPHVGNMCPACQETRLTAYRRCGNCQRYFPNNQLAQGGYWVRDREALETEAGAEFYCRSCRPPEPSRCQPKRLDFVFPALGTPEGVIQAEEIKEITLGGGTVSESGLNEIRNFVIYKTKGRSSVGVDLPELNADNFDHNWVTNEGTMPKRIAKILISERNLKLSEDLMSEIGNLARSYTSQPATYRVALTRDINKPKHEFVNDGSCWWSSYWFSRCTLKSMGGFGIRLFNDRDQPTGRAWMIPLRVKTIGTIRPEFSAEHETLPANAYVVFNAYDIDSQRADSMQFARLIAQMTGKSYRKVGLRVTRMYVNGTTIRQDDAPKGVLVAEQSLCNLTQDVILSRIPISTCACSGAR